MELEKLKTEFAGTGEMKGYRFYQLYDTKTAYIYKVVGESTAHYEIFKKKAVGKMKNFETREYYSDKMKEVYPKSKNFGDWAWCCFTEQDALNRLEKLKV